MRDGREIRYLGIWILISFGIVGLSAMYWAVVGSDTIVLRDDNPRIVEREAQIQRGTIFDRNDNALVITRPNDDGIGIIRDYQHPSTASALGYFSLQYGTGGVENAFDTILRGDNKPYTSERYVNEVLLHQAQVGSDIRLTLDLALQDAVANTLANKKGAVVMLSVPDGEILAMANAPTYDPNTLDDDWATLIESDDDPFFNRVVQGEYQPGGMIQTPLMATALLANYSADTVTADATSMIRIDDLELACTSTPPNSDLSLAEAYDYGCPRAFVLLANQLGLTAVENILDAFFPTQNPSIVGISTNTEDVALADENETDLIELATGQGNHTSSPLNMAIVSSAILNNGNAPEPILLDSIRLDVDSEWQDSDLIQSSTPILTQQSANQMRDILIDNAPENLQTDRVVYGGHRAIAYSGDERLAWFMGFVQNTNTGNSIVIALIIEDADIDEAVDTMGYDLLSIAYEQIQEQTD